VLANHRGGGESSVVVTTLIAVHTELCQLIHNHHSSQSQSQFIATTQNSQRHQLQQPPSLLLTSLQPPPRLAFRAIAGISSTGLLLSSSTIRSEWMRCDSAESSWMPQSSYMTHKLHFVSKPHLEICLGCKKHAPVHKYGLKTVKNWCKDVNHGSFTE